MFYVQYSRQPEDAAEAITQKFLGIQRQCVRCHDHPFDAWTQTDFYGVAAFFAHLRHPNMDRLLPMKKEKEKKQPKKP